MLINSDWKLSVGIFYLLSPSSLIQIPRDQSESENLVP